MDMLKVGNFFTPKISCSANSSDNNKYPNLKPLRADTVSFGAMKKTAFEGFELACVNMFKAPLEKFIDKSDFESWANEQLAEKLHLEKYKTGEPADDKERIKILSEWKDYLTEKNEVYKDNPAMSLIIFHSITHDLKTENRDLPPFLQPRVLADTMTQISDNLKKDKNYKFNFNKMYKNNLRLYAAGATKNTKKASGVTKWVKIPSYEHDSTNFTRNVRRLKMLSHDSWCTKSFNAEPYLKKGDFYIYLKNGQPKAAIRMVNDAIEEIQGEKNDSVVPWKYANEISLFVHKNHLDDDKVSSKILSAKIKLKNMTNLKNLVQSGTDVTPKQVFNAMGVLEKVNDDGTFTLSNFSDLDEDLSMENINIDHNKLFENVSEIIGDATFAGTTVTNLKNLQHIGGNAVFSDSAVQKIDKLKTIGGSACFSDSQIENIDSLEKIGADCTMFDSKIKKFVKLKMIGGSLNAVRTPLESLGDLMSVKGDLYLADVPLKTTGNLQFVGGSFDVSQTEITGLGKIKTIKGDAVLKGINDIGDLKTIGGRAVFGESGITDTKNLSSIGGIADFRNSKVKEIPNLKFLAENVWVDKNSDLSFEKVKMGGSVMRVK